MHFNFSQGIIMSQENCPQTSSEQPSQPRTDKYLKLAPSILRESEGESHYNIYYLNKSSGTGLSSQPIRWNLLLLSPGTRIVPASTGSWGNSSKTTTHGSGGAVSTSPPSELLSGLSVSTDGFSGSKPSSPSLAQPGISVVPTHS